MRALQNKPKVLLLDEPTASLDREAEKSVEALLAEQMGKGVAIVLVTHDVAQANRMASRHFTMIGGRLSQDAGEKV